MKTLICGCNLDEACYDHRNRSLNPVPTSLPLETQAIPEYPLVLRPTAHSVLSELYNEVHDIASDIGVLKDVTPYDSDEVLVKLLGLEEAVAKARKNYWAAVLDRRSDS